MSKLEMHNVHKSFGPNHVLRGIDLEVDEHEVVCLIGSSGCGKSTLLKTVNLLEPIDEGTITIDGADINSPEVKPNELRKSIGIVFQAFNLLPHMNAVDNVTLGLRRAQGVPKEEADERATVLLRQLGLADHMHKYPNQMSGGQQQRVAICRALVSNPQLLLLDEITSALDPELVAEVLNVIRSLAEEGLTMILATHEMGFAKEVADKVAFLHLGTVHEIAPPAEIFSDPYQERTQEFLARIIAAGRL